MTVPNRRNSIILLCIFNFLFNSFAQTDQVCVDVDGSTSTDNDCPTMQPLPPLVHEDCRLVMAQSSLPQGGWGMFSLVHLPKGVPISSGDLVIQLTDVNITYIDDMRLLINDYLWQPDETGGFYEALNVISLINGVGMLANGLPSNLNNVLPFVPKVDEGGLTRLESPGAGSITHYHNYSFFSQKPIEEGGEIFIHYGDGWFQERSDRLVVPRDGAPRGREINYLRQHGRCLDNIRPGRSKIPHVGRGAFATRELKEGDIVAPVPLLPINGREVMDIVRVREDDSIVTTKQLLLNYCWGHSNSSILFYPYGPLIGLINHGGPKAANVRLQWSTSEELFRHKDWLQWPLDDIKSQNQSGLLMEFVAIRNIAKGEEILMDYGEEWSKAWLKHIQYWEPPPNAAMYAPSYVQDDAVRALRIAEELRVHPYPDNVFTSCFYRYSDHKNEAERNTADTVTTFRWNMTRGLFELKNLRPCEVLDREHSGKDGTLFTVRVRNRFGLPPNERLPKGAVHIVTHVPRQAIRFSDKLYTTDQHLENAFRHEIGIPDHLFPSQWKDLA